MAKLIPPRPPGLRPSDLEWDRGSSDVFVLLSGESAPIEIPTPAGGIFDPLGWGRALTKKVVSDLLDRRRAARLVTLHAQDPRNPSLEEVLGTLVGSTWDAPTPSDPRLAPLRHVARRVVLDYLLKLADDEQATAEVRAAVFWQLDALARKLESEPPANDPAEAGVRYLAMRDLRRAIGGQKSDPNEDDHRK